MKYEVIIDTDANNDLTDIALWHEEQRIGLGIEFTEQFDYIVDNLSDNPKMYKKYYLHFHKALLNQFQYAMYYSTGDSGFVIN